MPANPIALPRHKFRDSSKQEKVDPIGDRYGLSTSIIFAAIAALLVTTTGWARRWLISGAPVLTYFILLGASKGHRTLPFIPLWTLFTSLNLLYAVAATSWLLYGAFIAGCYPAIFLSCLFQFSRVADLVRGRLRSLLVQLQFVNDKIAFFNIPALEIDTDVDGLMVVRGLTISLSTLTIEVHGIELGIKLSDDMELAIQTDLLTIPLFRSIEIGNVYANLKGGEHEMTFHELEESTTDGDGYAVMITDTPLLKAAALSRADPLPGKVKMTEAMTDGSTMRDSSAKSGFESIVKLSPDHEKARKQYQETLQHIHESSSINQCEQHVRKMSNLPSVDDNLLDHNDDNEVRAATCSELHQRPSVPHPPQRSIRVTTLQNLTPPYIRAFLHRLPLLLRMLLFPLTYFHPISIASITATGSGRWLKYLLEQKVFEDYAENDSEIRRLENKISTWLADANFAIELVDVIGLAQVPLSTSNDTVCSLAFGDVMAYRTLPETTTLKEVVRLGGADATFVIPSFLLPHHEHILPPVPSTQDKNQLAQDINDADGMPKTVQAEQKLTEAQEDIANVKISVHVSLPACFDQDLLNFIAALVKATKVVEMEKEPSAMDGAMDGGFKNFTRSLNNATKDGMKKAMVGGIINDKWIAKLVGKITKKLETAQGDIGYSGNIPVALEEYRPSKGHTLPSKLLA